MNYSDILESSDDIKICEAKLKSIDWEEKNKFSIGFQRNIQTSREKANIRLDSSYLPLFQLTTSRSKKDVSNHNKELMKKYVSLLKKPKSVEILDNLLPKNNVLKRWLLNIKEHLQLKKFGKMNANQFFYFGDNSYILKEEKQNRKLNTEKLIEVLCSFLVKYLHTDQFLKKIPTINPEGRLKLCWNIFICLCILFQFFTITIELFFDSNWDKIDQSITSLSDIVTELLKYFIVLDVFLNMFTGYFNQGNIVMEPKKVLKNYFNKLLIIDVLVIFPFFLKFDEDLDFSQEYTHRSAFYNSKLSIIKLLFVFRLVKLTRTYYFIEQILSTNEKTEGFLALLKLCFKILFTAHIFACIWYFIGDYSKRAGDSNWLSFLSQKYSRLDWRTYYLYSLYWSITTMITVGYGDITPTNNMEVGFVILSMVISCGVFGYSLSNIGIIFEKIFAKDTLFIKDLRVINRYMKRKKINYELQAKVRTYLNFINRESERIGSENEDEIINKLSSSLKKELLLQANGNIIHNHPTFNLNFSLKTIEKLTELLKPVDLAPNDVVFKEGSVDDDELYFVSKGRIDMYINYEDDLTYGKAKRFHTFKEGDLFGEKSFFASFPREYTALSFGYTRIYILKRSDFLDVLKNDEFDFEKFCEIRDSLLLYNNFSALSQPCISCSKKDHDIFHCSFLKYLPIKEYVIRNHISNKKRNRRKFKRRIASKRQALADLNLLSEAREQLESKYDFTEYQSVLEKINSTLVDRSDRLFKRQRSREKRKTLSFAESHSSEENPQETQKSSSSNNIVDGKRSQEFSQTSFLQEKLDPHPGSLTQLEIDRYGRRQSIIIHKNFEQNPSKFKCKPDKEQRNKGKETSKNQQAQKNMSSNNVINTENQHGGSASTQIKLFDMTFDVGRNFYVYFPHNNKASLILQRRDSNRNIDQIVCRSPQGLSTLGLSSARDQRMRSFGLSKF